MKERGSLFIVSAPSGAGKTTLVEALITKLPDICASISFTTRPKRPGEEEGVNYYFISHSEFKTKLSEGIFLEHAQVFGHFYGTSHIWVEEQRQAGKDVVLEIDWQGARQVRTQFVDAISIFILPPSLASLQERLQKRHQDKPDVIRERMREAKTEMSHYLEYDYVVSNDLFEVALEDLKSIVLATRLQLLSQKPRLTERLHELLS